MGGNSSQINRGLYYDECSQKNDFCKMVTGHFLQQSLGSPSKILRRSIPKDIDSKEAESMMKSNKDNSD